MVGDGNPSYTKGSKTLFYLQLVIDAATAFQKRSQLLGLNCSVTEKRKLKSNVFEWSQYIAINSDLIDSGIITKDKACNHFIKNGYKLL